LENYVLNKAMKGYSSLTFSNQERELYKSIIMKTELVECSEREFNELKENLNIPPKRLRELIDKNLESEIEMRKKRINDYLIIGKEFQDKPKEMQQRFMSIDPSLKMLC
jgi:hypothetical protein